MTACNVEGLAISIEEKKIAKGVGASNQVFVTRYNQCITQIGRPLRSKFEQRPRRRVAECQNRGVKSLPRRGPLKVLGLPTKGAGDPPASPPGVYRISDDGMSDVLQMHPNLMGTTAVQIETKQIRDAESSDHPGVGA
jgi:hypothetical protein